MREFKGMTRIGTLCLVASTIFSGFPPTAFPASPAQVLQALTPEEAVDVSTKLDGAYHLSWIPRTHTIAYSLRNAAENEAWIYSIDIQSGYRKRLFSGTTPEPSPDGKYLAYIRYPNFTNNLNNPHPRATELWVANVDGSANHELTEIRGSGTPYSARFINVAWSPDSRRILLSEQIAVFGAGEATPVPSGTTVVAYPAIMEDFSLAIRTVDALTGASHAVANVRGAIDGFGWLDNQTAYVSTSDYADLVTGREYRCEAYEISIATGKLKPLIPHRSGSQIYAALANSTGDRVATHAAEADAPYFPWPRDLSVYSRGTGTVQQLTTGAGVEYGNGNNAYAWTPDGKSLIYTDGPFAHRELFRLWLNGEKLQVTHGPGLNSNPEISSDGRYLAWSYTDPYSTQKLRVARIDGTYIRDMAILKMPLQGVKHGRSMPVTWRSSDGISIDGYLMLPVDYVTSKRYPMVVLIHGGPTSNGTADASEWPGEMLFVALLSQRGYAVFQPDYRASGLYGYGLIRKMRDKREIMYRGSLDDIIFGVRYLENAGIANPRRVVVLGHSSGSYEVNWIITHSHLFRAAVSYEGGDAAWDWGGFIYFPDKALEWFLGGSPLDVPERYRQNSVLAAAKGITTPTLFINCENGINSAAMVWLYAALRAQHVNTEFLFYRGEDHIIAKRANQLDLLHRLLSWISQYTT